MDGLAVAPAPLGASNRHPSGVERCGIESHLLETESPFFSVGRRRGVDRPISSHIDVRGEMTECVLVARVHGLV